MKKLFTIFVCAVLAFSIGGCGKSDDDSASTAKKDAATEKNQSNSTENNNQPEDEKQESEQEEPNDEPSIDPSIVKLERAKARMSTKFKDFNGNYRYDWGDNNEYSMLFDFFDDSKNNSATFSDGKGTTISYFYNQNLIWSGTCKIDADTMEPKNDADCTAKNKKDSSEIIDLTKKILGTVDLTIDDLKISE